MLCAYITFVVNAIIQGRTKGEEVEWEKKGIALAIGGAVVLATSAFLAVTATENLATELKISEAIAGLFITSTMSILPELFATWHLAKDGQESTAATAVCADNTLTITLGLFPLAMIWLPVKPEEFKLFCVNMAAVVLFAVLAATLMYRGSEKYSFSIKDVLILCGTYVVYVAAVLFGVLKVFS
nr:sodium/calcium exchanger protein [Iningainema tapete]